MLGVRGGVGMDKHFCAPAARVKCVFTHLQMTNGGVLHRFWSPHTLPKRPILLPDFCKSRSMIKDKTAPTSSHHPHLRKNGGLVIFWCIACHPACKQDANEPLMPPRASFSFPLMWLPKDLSWVIDRVLLWHHRRRVGSLPTQPAQLASHPETNTFAR